MQLVHLCWILSLHQWTDLLRTLDHDIDSLTILLTEFYTLDKLRRVVTPESRPYIVLVEAVKDLLAVLTPNVVLLVLRFRA